MPSPVLVGYDPRRLDRAPVDFGVAVARFTGAPLIVASVEAGAPLGQVDEDLVADCTQAVEEVDAELRAAGIDVECRKLKSTSAARALHDAAEELDAGLLVVGSTTRSAVGRVLPGSTGERLFHGAPCPIAVSPRGWTTKGGLKTIGVAYVDTDEGRQALHGAYDLARRAGAALRVLSVVKLRPAMYAQTEPTLPASRGKSIETVEGEHRLEMERRLRRIVDALEDNVPTEVDTFIGDPAEVVVDVSRHLDLLVCGSRGYGPLRAVLLGSVSRRVTAESHCPVIVLPRGVKASLEALVTETPGAAARA